MKRLLIGIGVATIVVTGSAVAYGIYWKIERNKKREILIDPANLGYKIVEDPENKEITYYKNKKGEKLTQLDYRCELGYLMEEINMTNNRKKMEKLMDIFYEIKEESDKIYKDDLTIWFIDFYEELVKFRNKGL